MKIVLAVFVGWAMFLMGLSFDNLFVFVISQVENNSTKENAEEMMGDKPSVKVNGQKGTEGHAGTTRVPRSPARGKVIKDSGNKKNGRNELVILASPWSRKCVDPSVPGHQNLL